MSVIRVAFQGESGAFSEAAARSLFGPDAALVPVPCRSFSELGEAVETGEARYGLLPVENSRAGTVLRAYDLLADSRLHVVAETFHRIRHMLMGLPGADVGGLRQILSHPVALAQCTRFLGSRPGIEAVAVYDTAGAAREAADRGDPGVAAIAGRAAADRHGLAILAEEVQDTDDNTTRFYLLAREAAERPALGGHGRHGDAGARLKAVLVFEVADEPGSLVRALTPLARLGVNMTKLASRPLPEPWTYRFFLEAETPDEDGGSEGEEQVDRAVAAMEPATRSLRVIGRFRAARAPGSMVGVGRGGAVAPGGPALPGASAES